MKWGNTPYMGDVKIGKLGNVVTGNCNNISNSLARYINTEIQTTKAEFSFHQEILCHQQQ